jgi:hypothetical protein
MGDTIRTVDYYYTTVPNEPGEGARVVEALKEEGVNLLAFHGFPTESGSQLDFFPEDSRAFVEAAERAGIELSPKKTAFLIEGRDRPGACADWQIRLAQAGINITAMEAVISGEGRYGALLWVTPDQMEEAEKALGA